MHNFNNNGKINIQEGNINIYDNSSEIYKLLIHCSNEELLNEKPFRIENIKLEQKRKIKRLIPMYIIFICTLTAAIYYIIFTGNKDIVSLIFAAASFLTGYSSLAETISHNEFQRGERDAIDEINRLLKQRRAI